ncbi:MAG: hypothetical protein V1930_09225 [Pseudomonadota bacterium]
MSGRPMAAMDKVVDLQERAELKKHKEERERARVKLGAVQKVLQCASCHFRCAMCGLLLKESDYSKRPEPDPGLTFCESCGKEFEDFLSISRGESPKDPWHNREWVTMWSAWLTYRKAITNFINSVEFKNVME